VPAPRDRYEELYDSDPVGYVTLDARGKIVNANLMACTLLGVNRKDVMKHLPLTRFIAPADADMFNRLSQDVLQVGTRQACRVRLRDKTGDVRWIQLEGFAVSVEAKRLTHWRTTLLDISAQKKAEQGLQQTSELFARAILDSIPSHVCVLNEDGVIVRVNDSWREFARHHRDDSGMTVGEVGQNYLDLCRRMIAGGESTVQVLLDGIQSVLAGSRPHFASEYVFPSSNEMSWFLMRVTPLKEASGVVLSLVDISERVRMQQTLDQYTFQLIENRERLELLSGKLIESQDQERRRIARDLHDDISQRLAALVLDVASLEQRPLLMPEFVADSLEPIRRQLEQLSGDVHNIAYTLHPTLLEHAGLLPAVEDHIHQVSRRAGLQVGLEIREIPGSLPLDQATCLFRVLQESLQNVVRHAGATEATVKLSGSPKGVGLSVIDNGKGFDAGDGSAHQKGLGLISLEERLRPLNGFLYIRSRPADGTKVCAWIPLTEDES
jgi:PAS domain S-box-containing protein